MSISTGILIAGVVLLLLGLLRKVKRLIWIGIIVAVVAAVATGVIGIPQAAIMGLLG